jgi:hypothetical protein
MQTRGASFKEDIKTMTKDFKLTDEKIKDIVKFCDAIYDRSRELQVKDYILDRSRTGKEINLQGMGAEIWYKEKHGLPYNLDATLDAGPRSYKKDVDCVRDGFKLEVKQTSYPTGCLFIASVDHYNRPRKLISDMYVLIIGNFPNYSNDLHISDVTLTNKYFDKTSNTLCPTMHPKIGKFGYHVEQDEMYETFEEAVKSDGRTTKRNAPALS